METLIVGHGPSLIGKKLGETIDQFQVVRLKRFTKFHEKADYGERTDYLCSSTEVMPSMLGQCEPKEYWGYPKKGSWDKSKERKFKDNLVIPLETTEFWNTKFKERSHYFGSGADGRNVSTGLAALIIAAERLGGKIILAGFDTVLNPSINYQSVYNPGTSACVNHKWEIEHKMLPEIAEYYEIELCVLLPRLGIMDLTFTDRNSLKAISNIGMLL